MFFANHSTFSVLFVSYTLQLCPLAFKSVYVAEVGVLLVRQILERELSSFVFVALYGISLLVFAA